MSSTDAAPARFAMIDGLRGLAALWVACLHVFLTGRSVHEVVPRPLAFVLEHGDLGVPVFFVLSGFAIAWSLREVSVDARAVGLFILRRSVRLDPPYWATIAIALATMALSNVLLRDRQVASVPVWNVVAHVLYVPDLIGVPKILDVFWTLFIEMQFYLFFVLQLWIARRMKSGPAGLLAVFIPIAVASVIACAVGGHSSLRGTFVPFWWFYFIGVIVCWGHEGQISRRWAAGMLAIAMLGVLARPAAYTGAAVVTGGLVLLASWTGRMGTWFSSRPFQYLGRISYSLYLIHPVAGQRFGNLAFRVFGDSPGAAVVCTLVALAGAIGAAHVLWWAVERPSLHLARKIQLRGPRLRRRVYPLFAP